MYPYNVITLTLMQIPALLIGFVGGTLFMRDNYLRMVRYLRAVILQQQNELNRLWNFTRS